MAKPDPEDLATIRHIYMSILQEPWFNRNAITERELLKLVLRTCGAAGKNPDRLERLCRDEARERFSRRM